MSQVAVSTNTPKSFGDLTLNLIIDWMEKGWLPDSLIRFGIRRLCGERLRDYQSQSLESAQESFSQYVAMLKSSAVAVSTDKANEQHYELPPEFFHLTLGKNKKYSCCHFDAGQSDLDIAEIKALEITVERAEIKDGMKILELGCGWGSLSLYMAEKFPGSKIYALSNSAPQREYIMDQAARRNLKNIEVLTRDVSQLISLGDAYGLFDRVVSVEMFEHLRNYELMLERVRSWLKPSGKLFLHIFTHQNYAYLFDTEGSDNWMGRYFFTGGQMPSQSLLAYFQRDLKLENQWAWDGTHYEKTSNAWLLNLDKNRAEILVLFKKVYGERDAEIWIQRWRVFFMSCAELFGYGDGKEWGVSHYLFANRD